MSSIANESTTGVSPGSGSSTYADAAEMVISTHGIPPNMPMPAVETNIFFSRERGSLPSLRSNQELGDVLSSSGSMHAPLFVSRSGSNLMVDQFNSTLREVDADILELGVEEKRQEELADFDDQGRRLEASESVASLTELASESMQEIDANSERDAEDVESPLSEEPQHNKSSFEFNDSSRPLSKKSTCSSSSNLHAIAEDSTTNVSAYDAGNNPNGDFYIGDQPSESPSKNEDEQVDEEAVAIRIAMGRHNRSDSFDRRMEESAQFAEAVGESSLVLKKIIEEDSSSDFDDDDIDEGGNSAEVEIEHGEKFAVTRKKGSLLKNSTECDMKNDNENITYNVQEDKVDVDISSLSSVDNPAMGVAHEKIHDEKEELPQSSVEIRPQRINSISHEEKSSSVQRSSRDSLVKNLEGSTRTSALSLGTQDRGSRTSALSFGAHERDSTMSIPNVDPSCVSYHPPFVDWKFTRQYSSGSNLEGKIRVSLLQSAGGTTTNDVELAYRGINLPEITKRGVARGNYAQLHRKAWLEVTDKHHRYGKNLRMYYKHWESLGHPYHMFFDWLDSKGDAIGKPLPDIPDCPRDVLDSDTVLYITDPDISASYALNIVADADGRAIILQNDGQSPVSTGKEGWIFILRDHVFYGSQKVTSTALSSSTVLPDVPSLGLSYSNARQRFHHSSFFGGKAVASAGIFLTDDEGRLTRLYPHSGHYRPGEAHMQRALFFLQQRGVDLSTFSVDMQQIFKVSRKTAPKGGVADEKQVDKENDAPVKSKSAKNPQSGDVQNNLSHQQMKKSKKTDCLHLMCGLEVAYFLAHKAVMIEKGVFHQIHKIRRASWGTRSSVIAILNYVN